MGGRRPACRGTPHHGLCVLHGCVVGAAGLRDGVAARRSDAPSARHPHRNLPAGGDERCGAGGDLAHPAFADPRWCAQHDYRLGWARAGRVFRQARTGAGLADRDGHVEDGALRHDDLPAGLSGVNRELYEAAAMDGANAFERLCHVTIPSIRHAFVIVGVLGFIRGFRVFTEVYATTGGGPGGSTEVIMTHVYKIGFVEFDYGYAAAVSFLVFAFTALGTVAFLGWDRRYARGR